MCYSGGLAALARPIGYSAKGLKPLPQFWLSPVLPELLCEVIHCFGLFGYNLMNNFVMNLNDTAASQDGRVLLRGYSLGPVTTWMGDWSRAGPSWCVTSHLGQLSLLPSVGW